MENFCKNASKTFQKRGKKISEKESFKQLIQICTENCVYTIFQQSLESQVRLRKAFLERLKCGSFWLSCTGTEGTAVTVYSPMSVCVVTWSCVRPVWQPQRERGCAAARAEGDTPRCPRAALGSERERRARRAGGAVGAQEQEAAPLGNGVLLLHLREPLVQADAGRGAGAVSQLRFLWQTGIDPWL